MFLLYGRFENKKNLVFVVGKLVNLCLDKK